MNSLMSTISLSRYRIFPSFQKAALCFIQVKPSYRPLIPEAHPLLSYNHRLAFPVLELQWNQSIYILLYLNSFAQKKCFGSLSMWLCVALVHSFKLLRSAPFYNYITHFPFSYKWKSGVFILVPK